jgi:5'-nucleotidase
MMNRRYFIKKTSNAAALLSVAPAFMSFDNPKIKHITILHTNDVHSHIDPFPSDHPRNPNMGGASRRAAMIENVRKQNPNVLLLDAGDTIQGTPYFNMYGGELEWKLMSLMQYNAMTIGNHEFDNGLEGLIKNYPHATFDIICSNYDFKNTIFEGKTKGFKIYELSGIKIGVFGLGVELEGLVDKGLYKETKYLNPIEIAQDNTNTLKSLGCDLVVCLSHLGYNYTKPAEKDKISDVKLAALTHDIDLIIGGHTHTFLDEPKILKNKAGKEVIINQVGAYGINIGRIDFIFTDDVLSNKAKNIEVQ